MQNEFKYIPYDGKDTNIRGLIKNGNVYITKNLHILSIYDVLSILCHFLYFFQECLGVLLFRIISIPIRHCGRWSNRRSWLCMYILIIKKDMCPKCCTLLKDLSLLKLLLPLHSAIWIISRHQ